MILTGPEIKRQMDLGEICIDPFNEKHIGPNSYDVTLNSKLICYDFDLPNKQGMQVLDMKGHHSTCEIEIPEEGLILSPGDLYLAMTNETAVSKKFVPMLEGRSSIGRLGINIHSTAGFGDIGWGYTPEGDCIKPTWTLEISVIRQVRIYPNVKIGQVYFMVAQGDVKMYTGKYSSQKIPQSSMSFKDFDKSADNGSK